MLLDFDQDLYGQSVKLEFVDFIRPEERFELVDALLTQITADRERAQEMLKHDR